MEFRILGPLEALEHGQPLPLGGAKQRMLLAALLLRAGQPVSVDRLIEDLWAESPPKTASHVIQVYVSELRKVLGDGVIVTRKPGYQLSASPHQIDLSTFEQKAELGRRALESGDVETAAAELRAALELWRGAPLADFTYEAFAQNAIARLDELRLAVTEERIEADLRLGRHGELIGELDGYVRDHPLRERPRGQLMLALYRSGRQAEALDAYQKAREALVEELGIDPSPALQELERAVLRQDEALTWKAPGREEPVVSSAPPRRAILMATRSEAELEALLPLPERLAHARTPHELILLALLPPGADVSATSRALHERRDQLDDRGIASRVAAFTSYEPANDVLRMAGQQDVDLLLLGNPDAAEEFGDLLTAVLSDAPCDVAFPVGGRDPSNDDHGTFVLVPFGGGEHDWAALELGAWVASALEAPLRLIGTEAAPDANRRDASRLLATAALAVQQLAGIATEPILAERGPEAVIAAAEDARLLIMGLPPEWRTAGLGATRRAIAAAARPPVMAVRRGTRPGGMAPPEGLTRFTWSVTPTR